MRSDHYSGVQFTKARDSSRPSPTSVQKYIIKFSNGLFLLAYHAEDGLERCSSRADARVFYSKASASRLASMFNGTVVTPDNDFEPAYEPPAETAADSLRRITVELGGGVYRGVQRGRTDIGLTPLVLFDDESAPKHERSTMAIPVNELSASRVKTEIERNRTAYQRASQRFQLASVGA